LRKEQAEVAAELGYGRLERLQTPVRAGLHDTAFHRRQHELLQRSYVDVRREALRGRPEAFLDRLRPGREVRGQAFADRRVGLVDLERKVPDGAAVEAVGLDEKPPVAIEQRKNAFDGIGDACPCRNAAFLLPAVGVMSAAPRFSTPPSKGR
jgi:hypothetical protein